MQLSEEVVEGFAVADGLRADAFGCDDSFLVDSLTEAQQIRLTHALDEYLKSLEQGTSFDVDEFCRDEPLLRRALSLYLGKLNALYGLACDRGHDGFGIPKTLGAFTLQREIGRGGMGIVYEATQAGMQRRVALKLLPMAATLDERQIARFKNESRAAGALDHPNIVPVYSVGEAEGIHYYAMQLIDGESVDHGIQRQNRPDDSGQQDGWKNEDWKTIVGWAIDAAEALHAAHETGVVHRDIKPSNLMVDHAGKIWVTDFGLARSQSNASLTQSGDVIGTMRYRSPEQAGGRSARDDPGLRHDLAVTYGKIGTLQDELRSSNHAIGALRHSEGLYGELAGEQPADAQTQLDWSISQNNLAESLHRAGQLEEAATYFANAIKTQEKLATAYPTQTYRGQLSTTLNNLGLLLSSSGANKEAEAAYRRSVELLKTSEVATPNPKQQQQLAAVLSNLSALLAKDDPTRAIEHAREALANQASGLEKEPGNAKFATQVITTLQTLGMAHSANGDLTAAVDSFGKSVEVGRQLLAHWPEQPKYRRDHVISQNHLGLALSKTGQLELALSAFEDALENQRSLAKDYPNDAETQSMLGGVLNNRGFLYQTLGRRNAATDSYDEAVKCQSHAAALAPQVDRYQSYLEKHRYNLGQLEAQR